VSAVLIRKGTLGVPCGLKSNPIFGSFKKLGLLTIALMLFVVLPKLMDIMDISKMDPIPIEGSTLALVVPLYLFDKGSLKDSGPGLI
jgi:hypothetical protein